MISPSTNFKNLWAPDFKLTQHLSDWRQDFINMKSYTGDTIEETGETTIEPERVKTV